MPSEIKIVVILLTLNQRKQTLECIASLRAIKEPPFEILVWDNGSSDSTVEAINAAYPDVHAHHHPDNLGVASGRNAGGRLAIESLGATHLLFLDNDMKVEPQFVAALLRPFQEDEKVGQTQAKLRFMHDPERLNDGGGNKINFILGQTTPVGFNEIDRGQYDVQKDCVSCGGAMMVRADVFEQLNGFDLIFDPFGPEDIDFSLRLVKAGYHALYVPKAMAYHAVSHTFGSGYTAEYARNKSRHWFILMRRHATPLQQIGFYTIGAPYLVLRAVIRETRRGNFKAILGLLQGIVEYARTGGKAKA